MQWAAQHRTYAPRRSGKRPSVPCGTGHGKPFPRQNPHLTDVSQMPVQPLHSGGGLIDD
jgi:hypothetical protein